MFSQLFDGEPKAEAAYTQLRERVGVMHPGVPLPSVPELVTDLAISRSTLDKVFGLMEQQGLIARKSRKGVFAADPRQGLGELAIVMNRILLEPEASPIYGFACSRLTRALQAGFPRWTVKMHLGTSAVPGPGGLPATLDLLDRVVIPRLRGVLSFHPLYEVETGLSAAGVPVLYLGAGIVPWGIGVFLDYGLLLEAGIRRLAQAGCRSVCLLWNYSASSSILDRDSTARMECAARAAADCGLRFREEHIDIAVGDWGEQDGDDLFMRMWRNQAERPDGILAPDDVLCRGVLRAVNRLGLDLPRDLRLVAGSNRGVALPYQRPVSRLEYDLQEWVDKAAGMLEAGLQGWPPEPASASVKPLWVQGETT